MEDMKKTWKVIVPPKRAADEEDEQLQHRQHLLGPRCATPARWR
jgi:hypothetical protein